MKKLNVTQGVPAEDNEFSNIITETLETLGFKFSQFYNVKVMRQEVLLHIVLGKVYYTTEQPDLCVVVMDDKTFTVTPSDEIQGSIENEHDYESIISKLERRGYTNLKRKSKLKKILQ